MKNQKDLAVIVPVYKVEPYIHQCIDSLINQTYPYLKIILVDDGSPDSCGAICDEYARKDSRIEVIHKSNGGLSSARNAGLELAKDYEFITFVDSDDWIDTTAYATCMEYLQEHPEVDILAFGINDVKEGNIYPIAEEQVYKYNKEEALREFVRGFSYKVSPSVWTKIFRRKTIEELKFFEGRLYEDGIFVFDALWKSTTYHLLPYPLYFYRMGREGSITTDKQLQFTDTLKNIEDSFPGKETAYQIYLNTYAVNLIIMRWYGFYNTKDFHLHRESLLPFIKRARKRPYINIYNREIVKLKTWLFLHFPHLYTWITLRLLKRKKAVDANTPTS